MRLALILAALPGLVLADPGAGAADAAPPDAAEVAAGAAIFERRCAQCHGVDGVNYRAPHLDGVVGRPAASVEGWDYSEPLRGWGGVWTIENLEAWLTKPEDLVPGNAMNFGGFRNKAEDRDRVIAFLRSHSAE
jgi:cytochrome c